MKLVIQRVLEASVHVQDTLVGAISRGLLVLVGIHRDDTEADLQELVRKLLSLRLFSSNDQKWSTNISDCKDLSVLLVSQFTLYGDVQKGSKVDFHQAMSGEAARIMFDKFVVAVKAALGEERVQTGAFGQYMKVSLVNDGPVTILLESKSFKTNK